MKREEEKNLNVKGKMENSTMRENVKRSREGFIYDTLNSLIYYTNRVDFDNMKLYDVRILLQSLELINITADDVVNASDLDGICTVQLYENSDEFVYYTVRNYKYLQLVKYNKITKSFEEV